MSSKNFISETLFEEIGFKVSYKAEKILFEDKTEHQDMVLFQNPFFGKMLMLDGATQVTMKDEYVYHEMMTHVPIFAHGNVKDVLIIGGGDGGIAEEVLKHSSVQSVLEVEIDNAVVEFSKQHFPEMSLSIYDDPRFELLITDGIEFIRTTDRKFDVILVDSTDPHGPGAVLFTKEFYAGCHKCLKEDGILVTQNGVPFLQPDELKQSVTYFRDLFAQGSCYLAVIPTYVGGFMALGWAAKNPAHSQIDEATIAKRFKEANFKTQYYTPAIHRAAFAYPQFIANILDAVPNKS